MTNVRIEHLADAPMANDRTKGFAFLRGGGDVFELGDGTWLAASAAAVQYAHRHPDEFSSAQAFNQHGLPVDLIPVAVDPPEHVKYRRLLDPMLAPRVINTMEDELRSQIRDLIAAFAKTGRCDVVTDIARLYPTQVFLSLFGLPVADCEQLTNWVETLNEKTVVGSEPNPTVIAAATAMFAYMQRAIDEKRQNPGDDMLSRVLGLEGDEAWANDEVLGLSYLFCLAGLDTVTAAIGFMMFHLARRPDLRHQATSDPGVLAAVIEEVLRIEPPAPTTPRVTTRDVELCGTTIPRGSLVNLCLATANRDASVYQHPNDIDLAQAEQPHATFGGGIHRCLGAHLARRELRLVAEEFHRVIPDYEIAPGFEPQVVWPSSTLHLASLPLVFPTG